MHEYEEIDLAVVANALPSAVDDYAAYVRRVARWLQAELDRDS